jgi:hypothetical protein
MVRRLQLEQSAIYTHAENGLADTRGRLLKVQRFATSRFQTNSNWIICLNHRGTEVTEKGSQPFSVTSVPSW